MAAGNLLDVINRSIMPSLVDYDPCALSHVPIMPFIEMRGDGLAVEVVIDSHVVPVSFTNYLIIDIIR